MLNLKDTVLYGTTGVCTVESIEEKKFGKEVRQYYVLKPIKQSTSTVFIPADNQNLLSKVRELLTPDEIRDIIKSLPQEPDIWFNDESERKTKYSEIIASGDRKACLKLIRTLCNRQKELSLCGKRLHLADERALKEAQRLIHDEFSCSLNISVDEVVSYISNEILKSEV